MSHVPSHPRSGTSRSTSKQVGRRAALSVALLVAPHVGCTRPLHAQATIQDPTSARLAELFRGFEAGPPVRIGTPSQLVEEAHVTAVGASTVDLADVDGARTLDLIDIRSVAVRDNHWLQGTLWGAAGGSVLGGVAGMMVNSWGCATPVACQRTEEEGAILWATLGGVVGGLGGFVIGRHSFYWRPVFP